jgi:hypothetical protein
MQLTVAGVVHAVAEESKKRRDSLSFREARPGDRKVSFRKPNAATQSNMLGMTLREGWGKAVFIDKIIPGSEAERLKNAGKIKEGDEIVMVSATFGNEMWSCRGSGKYRLEKSIAVRQGATIDFVVESVNDQSKGNKAKAAAEAEKEAARMSRLQKMVRPAQRCVHPVVTPSPLPLLSVPSSEVMARPHQAL